MEKKTDSNDSTELEIEDVTVSARKLAETVYIAEERRDQGLDPDLYFDSEGNRYYSDVKEGLTHIDYLVDCEYLIAGNGIPRDEDSYWAVREVIIDNIQGKLVDKYDAVVDTDPEEEAFDEFFSPVIEDVSDEVGLTEDEKDVLRRSLYYDQFSAVVPTSSGDAGVLSVDDDVVVMTGDRSALDLPYGVDEDMDVPKGFRTLMQIVHDRVAETHVGFSTSVSTDNDLYSYLLAFEDV